MSHWSINLIGIRAAVKHKAERFGPNIPTHIKKLIIEICDDVGAQNKLNGLHVIGDGNSNEEDAALGWIGCAQSNVARLEITPIYIHLPENLI